MSTSSEARQTMFSLIEKWQRGGLTKKQFCAQHNVALHSFYYWFKLYRRQNDLIPVLPSNRFVEIQSTPPVPIDAVIEILLTSGHRIIFNQPVSASFIKEVIS